MTANIRREEHNPWPMAVRRLALLLAAIFSLVFVALLMIVVPDQVSTPARPPAITLLEEDSSATTETTASPAAGALREISSDARLRLAQSLRPVADVTTLPDDLRTTAELWNQSVDDLTSKLVALVSASKGMEYLEALKKERRIGLEYQRLRMKFDPDHALWTSVSTMKWYEAREKAQLEIAAAHERWDHVASHYKALDYAAMIGEYSYDPSYWAAEKYYWKKLGWSGRATIALRSCLRSYYAARKALGIGSDKVAASEVSKSR